MTRARAADDFAAIRARMAELRGDPGATGASTGLEARCATAHGSNGASHMGGLPCAAQASDPTCEEIIREIRELIEAEPPSFAIWATDLRKMFARSKVTKYWPLAELSTRIALGSKLPNAIGDNYRGANPSANLTSASVEIVGEGEHWDCLRNAITSYCHASCRVLPLDEVVYGQVARDYEPPDLILTSDDMAAFVDVDTKFRYDRYKRLASPLRELKRPPHITKVETPWEDQDWFSNELSVIFQDGNPLFHTLKTIDCFLTGIHGPLCLVVFS